MRRSITQLAVTLAGVLVLVATTVLPLQPVFGEGGARRDVVRQEQQNRKDAVEHAKEAVDHGKQGHVEVTSGTCGSRAAACPEGRRG